MVHTSGFLVQAPVPLQAPVLNLQNWLLKQLKLEVHWPAEGKLGKLGNEGKLGKL